VEGYRIITGWGEGYRKVYFRAEFSKPFTGSALVNENGKHDNLAVINGHSVKALLNFQTDSNEMIVVKVGLSATSLANARLNLRAEVSGWNFDKVCRDTSDAWEKELEKITIEGTREQKQIFYTGMYHAFIQPNNLADVNGDYPAPDMTVRRADDRQQYSTLSLWDTYRAANPLYTLVQTKCTAGIVNSLLRQYDVQGYLPIWQLWGLENFCMIGNHAIPVIVDAALKNVGGFNVEHAYEAVKNSSMRDHLNSPFTVWEQYGYMPEDIQSQSVSITLEMAFDDWCVAQLAKKLGKTADYEHFIRRSGFYKNLYDTKIGFFRAKNKNGQWVEPFNPLKYSANGDGPFTEGNAWQYLFYVPQDMSGLVSLMGGKDSFNTRLDTFFTLNDQPSDKNGNASGFIGQYAHGNEPSHHAAYLYNFSGQPWKTQKYVAQVLTELYNNHSDGYAGNEDCGQMSAWYVFSAMGFYPFNPINGVYSIGSPILQSARMHLQNGKTFTVLVDNAGKGNCYIQSVELNGKSYAKTYITQKDITTGGTLHFVMGGQPNQQWGTSSADIAPDWGY
jgi:predicted alpha-1,2-mannosidase